MSLDNERESFEDAIRADIRQEILNSTKRRNRYSEQIAQIHREEEERKRLARSRRRKPEAVQEDEIPFGKSSGHENVVEEIPAKQKREKEQVDHTRHKEKSEKKRKYDDDEQVIIDDLNRKDFFKVYAVVCAILLIASGMFLTYVWRSIKLYEASKPENIIEQQIASIKAGASVDKLIFPEMEESEFSSVEAMKDSYIETLQKGELSYRFARENYQTGDREYLIYDKEQPVARITLQAMETEKRLGILPITRMQMQCIEPVMNILVWDYDIQTLDKNRVYINDVLVSPAYIAKPASKIQELEYLYEYVDLPQLVTYHVEGICKEATITIKDMQGNEVAYEVEGNRIIAAGLPQYESHAPVSQDEIDALQAAKTWSLFTTRDLGGPAYGLEQVRKYFIRDSYYWQKLGEYAKGIDITLVSDHNASETFFTEENVSEYRVFGEDCFSCRVSFNKHMKLNVGKEQIDKTDSIFYFVRVDDTDDGVDNKTWKIADIQAVVKQ